MCLAACAAAASAADEPAQPAAGEQVERLAAAIAGELSNLCPPAKPGDQAAYDRCRRDLFGDSLLRRSFVPNALWGRVHKDPATRLKDTNLTGS